MKIQVNDTNYPHYKKMLEIIHSHVVKRYPFPETDPLTILNKWEQQSKTIARRAVKTGLQDLIYQVKDFPNELKSTIDKELAEHHLPGLSELQGAQKKIINRVLKRHQIKTFEEFSIVKEEVIDMASSLSEEERRVLDQALSEFELAMARKKGI